MYNCVLYCILHSASSTRMGEGQPRSQGLSCNRPLRRARRDPGLVWSGARFQQITNKRFEGGADKWGICLYLVDYECSLLAFKTSYTWSTLDRIMSTGNTQQSPKKISKSSTTANINCCRLCKSVGDISCLTNIYRALLTAAEDIYGRPVRQFKINCCHIYYVGLVKDV